MSCDCRPICWLADRAWIARSMTGACRTTLEVKVSGVTPSFYPDGTHSIFRVTSGSFTTILRGIAFAMPHPSSFDQILDLLESQGLLGDEPCDVVSLECAAAIRAEKLSIDTMVEYQAFTDDHPEELQELVATVVESRARLEADALVPEVEVETVVVELEATIEALEQANQDRRATVDDLRSVDHELTLAVAELEVVTSQLDERTREVERLNDFVQAILAMVKRPMVVVDHDLVVRAWNEPASALLETAVKDAVGRPVGRLAPWFKTGPIADALLAAVGEGTPAASGLRLPGHADVDVVIEAIVAIDGAVVGAIVRMDPPDQG